MRFWHPGTLGDRPPAPQTIVPRPGFAAPALKTSAAGGHRKGLIEGEQSVRQLQDQLLARKESARLWLMSSRFMTTSHRLSSVI